MLRPPIRAIALLGLFLAVPCCEGVVISRGDGTGNTTAPADDPGFENIGSRGVGTAIYLGNRWVMTAAHLGPGPVFFGGTEYIPIAGETVQLSNPAGTSEPPELTPQADILLLRIPDEPGLPALHLPCDARQLGNTLTMIGKGHDREPEPTYWKVDVNPGEDDDVWTVVETQAESDHQGFRTLSSQSIRWGTGSTGLTDVIQGSNQGDVLSFTSSFTQSLGIENLAQAVRGDSGGATFQKNLGVWELVGLTYAVDQFENQPDGTRTAIYGNATFIADLFRYSDQLRAVANFEPNAGDVNGNGQIDASEIDALQAAKGLGRFSSCHFDVDANDVVDMADVAALLESAGTLVGDTDLDGVVGFSDFLAVSRSFGTDAVGWGNGDFDGNGLVGFSDFLDLSRQFGNGAPSIANPRQASFVPEPSRPCWSLIFSCLFVVRAQLRRIHRRN